MLHVGEKIRTETVSLTKCRLDHSCRQDFLGPKGVHLIVTYRESVCLEPFKNIYYRRNILSKAGIAIHPRSMHPQERHLKRGRKKILP